MRAAALGAAAVIGVLLMALASFLDEVWLERHCILQRRARPAARRVGSGEQAPFSRTLVIIPHYSSLWRPWLSGRTPLGSVTVTETVLIA